MLALGDAVPGRASPGRPTAGRSRSPPETGPERFLVGPKPKDGKPPRARHVTTIDYRWDEEDYLDRRAQLFVVAAHEGARARQLTTIAGGVSGIAWRPDSRAIAFVADPRPDAGPHAADLDLGGRRGSWAGAVGPSRARSSPSGGPVSRPVYSRDCVLIAGVGVDDPDFFDNLSPTLYVGRADESAPAVALAPDLDRPVGQWADTDLTGWTVDSPAGTGVGRRGDRRARHGPRTDAPVAVQCRPDDGPADGRAASGSRAATSCRSRSRWARDA